MTNKNDAKNIFGFTGEEMIELLNKLEKAKKKVK